MTVFVTANAYDAKSSVSSVIVHFINNIREKRIINQDGSAENFLLLRPYDQNKGIVDEFVRLSSALERLSQIVTREIGKPSSTTAIQELYLKDMRRYLVQINEQYYKAREYVFKNSIDSEQPAVWIDDGSALREVLQNINLVVGDYFGIVADKVPVIFIFWLVSVWNGKVFYVSNFFQIDETACYEGKLPRNPILNEMLNIAIAYLKGYQILETSIIYLNETGREGEKMVVVLLCRISIFKLVSKILWILHVLSKT